MKETNLRILIKTISHLLVVTSTLLFTSVLLDLSEFQTILMVSSGLTVGWVLYIIHEKIWNVINWKRENGIDKKIRSIAKVLTWRTIAIFSVFICALLANIEINSGLIFTFVFNTLIIILHFIHERIWNRIRFGFY